MHTYVHTYEYVHSVHTVQTLCTLEAYTWTHTHTHTHTLTIAKSGKVKGALKTGSRNGTTHASIIEEMGAWTGEERGGGWVRDKGEGGRIGSEDREGG